MLEGSAGYDSPEEAARGTRAFARVLVLEVSPDGSYAVAVVDKGRPGDPYPLEVICGREEDGRSTASSPGSNGSGYRSLPKLDTEDEYFGILTFWGEAPQGTRSVKIRWRNRVHELPVREGWFLFVDWDFPDPGFSTFCNIPELV